MALDVRNEPNHRPNVVQRRGLLTSVMTLAMLALASAPIEAQTGQITGTVVDAQSGAPLSEVQVYLVGQTLGALSRADGRFLILNVPAGSYDLRAERIGFGAETQTVQVTAGGTATSTFRLGSQALGLDEIVVTGTAGAARRREIGNSITQLNLADVPDRPVQVTDLLQGSAPGVEITGGCGEARPGQGHPPARQLVRVHDEPADHLHRRRAHAEPAAPHREQPRHRQRPRRPRLGEPAGQHQPERHRADRGHQGFGGHDAVRDRGLRRRDPGLHQAGLLGRPGVDGRGPAGDRVDQEVRPERRGLPEHGALHARPVVGWRL